MKDGKRAIGILFLLALIFGCGQKKDQFAIPTLTTPEDLAAHSLEFEKQVISVTENVHVAIGYGLANSIMIEGENGRIIIDAMSTVKEGKEVRAAFDQLSDKPVTAIIYTHNHTDHVFGATGIAGTDRPMVIAQETMPYHLDKIATVIRPIIEKRSYRMFGNYLNSEELVNCGIGPSLGIDKDTELGVIRPDVTFRDSLSISLEGIQFELIHAPGETPDQLFVWLPEQKILFCGDNFYKSFPNLYTIRGTSHRDVNDWKESLDKMRAKGADILIPSHTKPLVGTEAVSSALTDYRDAIQFVHDQTVRWMNQSLTPDEIVERVILPEHLASSPYLQEYYGKVEWTVRSIFSGYLGWFDGNPATLYPLNVEEKAKRLEQLAGGTSAMETSMTDAFEADDFQWALELSDYLLALAPNHEQAVETRWECLVHLGMKDSNPNARHYFLTTAKELKGLKNEAMVVPGKEMVHAIPMASIFAGMATFLNAEKAKEVEESVVFDFTDTGERYSVIIRKGVAEVQPYAIADPDYTVRVAATVWKEIAAEIRKPLPAFINGQIKVDGGKIAFVRFMDLFDR